MLSASFQKRFGEKVIDVELVDECRAGQVLVLFGPSGCGKTTALRALAGLERPERGRISFLDQVWLDVDKHIALAPQARGIGFVSQDYALFPHLTVDENIEFGLAHNSPAHRAQRRTELSALLRLDGLGARRPRTLSGGEQQRVALGRALAPGPRLLLLDEPLSALDAPTRDAVRRELRAVLTSLQTPAVVVTHDRVEALALGDRVAVMYAGRVLQTGPVDEVFSRPADVDTARIVGVETVVAGRVVSAVEGLGTIDVGGAAPLTALVPSDAAAVFVCIRAEDVTLERASTDPSDAAGARTHTSGRNRLNGTIGAITAEGPLCRVVVDVGFALTALVTRQARADLRLAAGDDVVCAVKATSITVVRR